MSCTPASGLKPFSASMCSTLQLKRIVLLSADTRRRHIKREPDVVRIGTCEFSSESVNVQTLNILNLEIPTTLDISTFQPLLFQYCDDLMSDTNPSTGRRTTRPTNADQHPGQVALDQIRKRRTKAEIARDKALQEETMINKKKQATKSITRIAELEDQMAVDDASTDSAHPRKKKSS